MKTIFVSKNQIKKVLQYKSKIKNNSLLPFQIIVDKESKNKPEQHVKEGDLFYCIEGRVDFVCEGHLVDKSYQTYSNGKIDTKELTGSKIKNGVSYKLKHGDWLWIPPNTPHQHNSTSFARLIIVKIPFSI